MRARDNPYRVERLHALAFRFNQTNWDRLWERLQQLEYRASVVGPHGSGKTALLLSLAEFLQDKGFSVRMESIRGGAVQDGWRAGLEVLADSWCKGLRKGVFLIVDGADLLSQSQWRGLLRGSLKASGLVVSSHRSRLLPILYSCRPTPALLADLMQELHSSNACGQPTPGELFHRHRGNLREALLELYDFHAPTSNPDCHPHRT